MPKRYQVARKQKRHHSPAANEWQLQDAKSRFSGVPAGTGTRAPAGDKTRQDRCRRDSG